MYEGEMGGKWNLTDTFAAASGFIADADNHVRHHVNSYSNSSHYRHSNRNRLSPEERRERRREERKERAEERRDRNIRRTVWNETNRIGKREVTDRGREEINDLRDDHKREDRAIDARHDRQDFELEQEQAIEYRRAKESGASKEELGSGPINRIH
jgi:hypothetical protein